MRSNTAKTKMLAGKPAFGYSLALGSPLAAEILASCGIDFLLFDTQHGSFGPDSIISSLIAASAGSAIPMARVARNDYTMIGRLLDEGTMGIVVPMVENREDAQRAADACHLPPDGTRSWGWGRATALGENYSEEINSQVFVAVQIESITAVDNAEAILSVPGVDGCWVGPADLALSLGIHPQDRFNEDRHFRATERVLEACRNTGKVAGYAGSSIEEALALAERGFRYITCGSDGGFLRSGAMAGIQALALDS